MTDVNHFGPLEVLLANRFVTAIYVDDDGIRYEIDGVMHSSEFGFASLEQRLAIVCGIVAFSGLELSAQTPIIDCVLDDGTRVHAEYMPLILSLLKPAAVLMQLSAQLSLAIDPEAALNASVETIGSSLGLPYVSIALHQNRAFVTMATFGEVGGPVEVLPLVHQYEQVGQLVVGRRDATVPLPQADKAILVQVAQQISEILRAIRLQSDLQAARERLVIAREEERRRLRRDLHDGLGPALASLPLKVDAAIDLVESDPATSVRLLGEVKRQAQQLVGDVRQVVNDLRPPALDELGLVEAVRSAIAHLHSHSSALQIRLDADGVPQQLPAAVEAAGYRIIMEAVTNVVKHAHAWQCAIRLEMLDKPPRMQLTVIDDGSGLPEEVRANVGLRSMRERAEELGGTFEIQSGASGGTCVHVSLPLPEGNHKA